MKGTLRMVLIVSLAAGAALGQTPEHEPLTLEKAVELALRRNPEICIVNDEMDALEGKIREVRSGAFPQVSLQGYGVRLRDPSILNSSSFDKVPQEFRDAMVPVASNMFDANVSVKQPLYTAGKVRTAIRLARVSLEEKGASRESVRQGLTFRMLQAFNDLRLAEANLAVIEETRGQRREHLEQARARFDNGVATEVDVLRSEVNVANMEPEWIRARNSVRLARSVINNLIVEDLEAPTRIAGKLDYRPWPTESLEALEQRALAQRPEIEAARKRLEQSTLAVALARAENRLSVDMEGQWGMAARQPENFFDNDYSRWSLMFSFKMPLFDSGRKAGLVRQATAQARAAEQRVRQMENDVRLEVKQAYDDMSASSEAIAAARLSVSQAETVRRMMQDNYRYGAATTLDVADSQTSLAVARHAEIRAIYDYEMAKARLRLASGSPILDGEENP